MLLPSAAHCVRTSRLTTLTALAVFVLFLASLLHAQIPAPTDAPKPLTAEQSAAAFKLPVGFRMEAVASEPLIASPSAVCWDERGRMFVSELHGYNLEGQLDIEELNKTGQLDTQVRRVQADEKFKRAALAGTFGVVKMLRDTDGDGRMDKADVWATNLPPAYGLVPARGGVIVACAPDIVFLADRDGDGRAEVRETLFTGFRTGALERGINSPQWGADGWIYFGRGWGGGKITGPKLAQPATLPQSDFRIRADGSAIEPVTGGTHTFGFAMTPSGDRFVVTTTIPGIFIAPLPWPYLVRNPDAATPSLESATGDRRAYSLAPPHPWRKKRADDPAYFKYYRDRYGPAESEAEGWFTAACSPLIYQDSALPGLQGQYFVCEPAGNLIHRALIETDGPALTLRRAPGEERSEFAASRDPWSHPMNLTHGPDGAIWVVDYYREIIEDYSAIPRHLQQQYGLYAGHDRGRIYRLTHQDAPRPPASDLSALDAAALAREIGSPLFWRRQTAQRLLVEHGETSAAPRLREILAEKNSAAPTLVAALRTLEGWNALSPGDLQPFIRHADPSVRVHALQLADRWFTKDEGRELLATALAAAASEQDPRMLIQFALSFGQTRDPRAFASLVRFARERLDVRWMDTAVLSSLSGRGVEMLAALVREPGGAAKFLEPLAQSVAGRRQESDLARALSLAADAPSSNQATVLNGLAKGRKNAARQPLANAAARQTLASFAASPSPEVRAGARALEDTFVATAADDPDIAPASVVPPALDVSDETFRKFVAALAGPRDTKRGHEVFQQACVQCHRIGEEGNHLGPDLLGELGVAEETLVRHLLLPNEHIRPGYETTLIEAQDGKVLAGLLTDDGATSLTLLAPGGVKQVLLRKDVKGARRLATSLMPSFAETLAPADLASLLAWLHGQAFGEPAVFPLKVGDNRRYLMDAKGAPFFVLGDTPWFLQKLPIADVRRIMDDRKAKGFNTLFLELLDDSDIRSRDAHGNVPFDPPLDITRPVEAFWKYADDVLEEAEKRGFLVIENSIWYGAGKGLWMHHIAPESCRVYGEFLARRYARFQNLMWMHCGDRNPDAKLAQCARELGQAVDRHAPHQLQTAHLEHEFASSAFFQSETWLDVNMAYTYGAAYPHVAKEYQRLDPIRPVLLGETGYENEPNAIELLPDARKGDLWTPFRIRRQIYWATLSGACGYCAGTRLWRFEKGWEKLLDIQSSQQAPRLLKLLASVEWWRLVPDFRHELVSAGGGAMGQGDYATTAIADNRRFALAYLPAGGSVSLKLEKLAGPRVQARWFDPASGEFKSVENSPFAPSGSHEFIAPKKNSSGDPDWVLLLEGPSP